MLGTNDARNDADASVAGIAGRLTALVQQVRAYAPGSTILLAAPTASCSPRVAEVAIPAAVAAADPPNRVFLVRQDVGFAADTDTWDGCHPNDSGAAKIAQTWLAAIQRHCPGPRPHSAGHRSKQSVGVAVAIIGGFAALFIIGFLCSAAPSPVSKPSNM